MLQELELNSTGYYQIATGVQYWVPVSVSYRSAAIVTAAHTNFFKNQNWSMRFWFSREPNGITISGRPRPQWAYVDPLKLPVKFGIYDFESVPPAMDDTVWLWPVVRDTVYYLNVQNRETRANGFFLKLDTISV